MSSVAIDFPDSIYDDAFSRVNVLDTSDAGDRFMAALCVKYLETKDISQFIEFPNLCASKVVKHRGVTII